MKGAILSLLSLLLLLTSCGSKGDTFRLEGRMRNMNQGEFWVYSPDGGMVGIDTIKVRDSRFSYELELSDDATLMIVFPNYSEQPVFASPGATVSIKGDASHLKEMIIQGTTDNEDLTTLRLELNDLTPPDIPKAVSDFIEENPASQVSIYLIQRYFLQPPDLDYRQASKLTKLMLAANPDNITLQRLNKQLATLKNASVGSRLPKFTATDIKGKKVTEAALRQKVNVVSAWASWNYTSINTQQRLRLLKVKYGKRLGLVSICMDSRVNECRSRANRDSLNWQIVCDGRMWDSPLMNHFGMADITSNVLIDSVGRIIAHDLPTQQLEERINSILR